MAGAAVVRVEGYAGGELVAAHPADLTGMPPASPRRRSGAGCPTVRRPRSTRLAVVAGDAARGRQRGTTGRERQPHLDVVVSERGRATSYSACGVRYRISGTRARGRPDRPDAGAAPAVGRDVRTRTGVVDIDLGPLARAST